MRCFGLLFTFLFLLAEASCLAQAVEKPSDAPPYSTYTTLLHKKSRKWEKRLLRHRLQLRYLAGSRSLHLKAHPVLRLKNLRFSYIFYDSLTGKKMKQKEVQETVLRNHVNLPASIGLAMDSVEHSRAMQLYNTQLRQFANGQTAARWIYNQWLSVAQWEDIRDLSNISVLVRRPFRKIAVLTIAPLEVFALPELPVLSEAECMPIDRFYELRKLKGYGLENIRYQPYTGHSRDILTRSHRVYFPKNKYEPEQHAVDSLRRYLSDNNLSILKADFFGSSSMEGDSLLNRQLQEKRVAYLYETLNDMSDDPIEADSIGFADGYETLLAYGKKYRLTWMDSLTRTELRDTLQKNMQLLDTLEPLLRQSRKAELKLVLAKKLNRDERIEKAYRQLKIYAYRSVTPRSGQISVKDQQRTSGLLWYLFWLYLNDEISKNDLSYAVNTAPNAPFVRVLFTYMLILQLEREPPLQIDSATWVNKLAEFHWESVFEEANTDIISLALSGSVSKTAKPMLHGMAVDIQYYTFKYIENGTIDASLLCRLSYPSSPGFYGLLLNRYAFIYLLTTEKGRLLECFTPPSANRVAKDEAKLSPEYINRWVEHLKQKGDAYKTEIESADMQSPSYYGGVFSDYYLFLKILFVKEDESVKQLVSQSDYLLELDLYWFLNYQVKTFDPISNYWLDEDVSINEMSQLLRKLQRDPGRLCPAALEEVSLSFYLKALYYIQSYYDPAQPAHINLSRDALAYISSYYNRRKNLMTPELETLIQRQLNYFYWLPGGKSALQYRF